ncbi:MAG TPA: hypothetical protein VEH31_29540, partial [Streptosporangiaceae bacterium]|nr:hypothetical protein [Streptosporangiaceae bacterium]
MNLARRAFPTVLILAIVPFPAAAQTASLLFTEGLRAYQGLDFAAAAQLLRRSLDPEDSVPLAPPDRLRALMYLGTADLLRENRDQAVATFRTLLLTDPRYRPDSLVFSPKITRVFAEVLETTKAVGLAGPPEARFPAGEGGLDVRAYATSRHSIEARVSSALGNPVATVFRGEITDSVTLAWNGLDSTGHAVPPGSYRLVVTSSLVPDQVLRYVTLPLEVSTPPVDTLRWPTSPQPTRSEWDRRFLVPGGLLGTALAVPAALGAGGARGLRVGAGLVVAAAGVIAGRPHASTPDRQAQAEWRARLRTARQENQRR